jgi:hypothetical protein
VELPLGGPAATVWSVTDETPEREQIDALRTTPIETILANHVLLLIQLAAVRLADTPPQLGPAQLAIDVVASIIDAGGERLGEHLALYRNALAEVQQVYVRAASGALS